MTLDSLPDLDTSGLCLVKTLSTALTCWPFRNMALRDGARSAGVLKTAYDVEVPRGIFARACSSSRAKEGVALLQGALVLLDTPDVAAQATDFGAQGLDAGDVIEFRSAFPHTFLRTVFTASAAASTFSSSCIHISRTRK